MSSAGVASKISLVLILIGNIASTVGAADKNTSLPGFEDTLTVLRDVYPRLVSVDFGRSLPLNEVYHAVVMECHQIAPEGLSREQESEYRENFYKTNGFVAIVETKSNALVLPLGTFPYSRSGLEHGDSRHLVYQGPSKDYGYAGERWAIYFDLEARKEFWRKEVGRPYFKFLIRDAKKILATNLATSLEVPQGVWVEHADQVRLVNGPNYEPDRGESGEVQQTAGDRSRLVLGQCAFRYKNGAWSPEDFTPSRDEAGSDLIDSGALSVDPALFHGTFIKRTVVPTSISDVQLLFREDEDNYRAELLWVAKNGVEFFELPQPTPADFVRLRGRPFSWHDKWKNGTNIFNRFGPYVCRDGRLWFGIYFYDGEGMSGVGGLGEFDLQSRHLTIHRLSEMPDYSVSAIEASPDGDIWTGLYVQPEGCPFGRGLLRYSPKKQSSVLYSFTDMINAIEQVGEFTYLAADRGFAVMTQDNANSVEVHAAPDGKQEVEIFPLDPCGKFGDWRQHAPP